MSKYRGMISVERLSKTFSGYRAVNDLSFTLEPGEVLGFLGPNGAGKTTTMKCVMGMLHPTEGTVRVADLDPRADAVPVKHAVGWLPDVPFLYDHLTPTETLAFVGGLYGLPPAEVADRASRLLAELDLADRADELIAGLSRGGKKKVALAMALVHRPRVLLLDEPTAGLDPQTVRLLKDRIRAEAASGVAVMLSSHQLEVVEELATHLLVIARGQSVLYAPMQGAMGRARERGLTLEGLFLELTGWRPAATTA